MSEKTSAVIARATNDKGEVVEMLEDKVPDGLSPWPFKGTCKLIVDGKTELDGSFLARSEMHAIFFNACRPKDQPND